ncbi:hypothetical protein BLNAU_10980 [Blattamonas nauphoetae]|uniref:Uncharacterized protein n=1 Tax=Blattamonas nauphoetae TaxID=2049346 RepID=A0ABQ9XR87_9EUKA|nr:hypothetical protein BLNAU_10980 [Blattamonas nauphoetae]
MTSKDVIHQEYYPFIEWNPQEPLRVYSAQKAFITLVFMVQNGYNFNEELLVKVFQFLSAISWNINLSNFANALVKRHYYDSHFCNLVREHNTPNTIPSFVDSLTILFSSSNPSIFKAALSCIATCLRRGSSSTRKVLISPELFLRILSTPHLPDLSVVDDQGMLNDILLIHQLCLEFLIPSNANGLIPTISNADSQSMRDMVLRDLLIPFEPSLVQICCNPRLLSWNAEYKTTFVLLFTLFIQSRLHQPTMDFVCSSRIPMAFQSLLSKVEDEDINQYIISTRSSMIFYKETKGPNTGCTGKQLLQPLEREGFRDGLEQTLLHDKSSRNGNIVRGYSFVNMIMLGMNSSESEIEEM